MWYRFVTSSYGRVWQIEIFPANIWATRVHATPLTRVGSRWPKWCLWLLSRSHCHGFHCTAYFALLNSGKKYYMMNKVRYIWNWIEFFNNRKIAQLNQISLCSSILHTATLRRPISQSEKLYFSSYLWHNGKWFFESNDIKAAPVAWPKIDQKFNRIYLRA